MALLPLEIIQPRAGLDTSNRFYKAYPGLLYDVQIAAIGGRYPNTYSLVSGPVGMTINSSSGVLTWPNPVTTGSPHSVSVRVTDALGATATVTWPVTVTTVGFIFIDANAGAGGSGTIGNPFNSIDDWYITKTNQNYAGYTLYWRGGTYYTASAPIEDGWRMAMVSNWKPSVWLAYPGETPVIDVTSSHIAPYQGHALYMDGITVTNLTQNDPIGSAFGVRIDSGADNYTFRNCIFEDMPVGEGGGGSNASGVMIANGGAVSNHVVFVGNTFRNYVGGTAYGILGYYVNKCLVEGNVFTNITPSDSKGVGPKMNNTHWYIRNNRIDIANGQAIWVDTYPTTANIESAYNLARGDMALWVGQETTGWGAFESYRNTYDGTVQLSNFNAGPASFDADVIINSSVAANHIDYSGGQTPTVANVLSGTAATGIIDANGNLQGAYRTTYLGTRGYEQTAGPLLGAAANFRRVA